MSGNCPLASIKENDSIFECNDCIYQRGCEHCYFNTGKTAPICRLKKEENKWILYLKVLKK